MAEVVFRSNSSALKVAFDPKVFGMKDTEEFKTDTFGQIVVNPTTGEPIKEKRVKDAISFERDREAGDVGVVRLDPGNPAQAQQIADLRKHVAFGTSYWEQEAGLADAQALLSGDILLRVPPELTDGDRQLIASLERFYNSAIPPKAVNAVLRDFQRALELFHVRGIKAPPENRALKTLKGRIVEFLYALEDAGVLTLGTEPAEEVRQPEGENDGRGDSEPGSVS